MTTRVHPSRVALVAVLFAVTTAAGCAVPSSAPVETLPAGVPGVQVDVPVDPPATGDAPAEGVTQFPAESVSQQNAREKAQDYLQFMAFSRSGLITQLEFEGFANADAVYAADVLNIDWNEQAAKKGADYLKSSSFSRQGLLDQLLFEGFTPEQAEYGVNASYGAAPSGDSTDTEGEGSTSQRNAVEKARDYLEFSSFSRSGLIKQLEFEGFSNVDAVYAVDSLDVNWNEQAALKAESYLNTSSFSRQGLLDQLLFEGFTAEQAEYGVDSVGL